MPGLFGFSKQHLTEACATRTIEQMQRVLSYDETFHQDALFQDASICSSRVHVNVFNPGPQPSKSNSIQVWLDGEFTNRSFLQNILQNSDQEKDLSDSEILAALYDLRGDFSFLKVIDGIFSAVIYDQNRHRLHLVSDRYGLRPLYWTVHHGELAWSSELKSFLELPGFEPKIDPLAVEDFFGLRYMIGDRTWFEGVELIPAATVLTWDLALDSESPKTAQQIQRDRYWWWDQIRPLPDGLMEDEITGYLGSLFRKAVKNRSLKGEKTGLTLSGGLDSRAIIAAMPNHGPKIEAITYGKKGCEDIQIAKRVAKVKGANFHAVEINSENWLNSRIAKVWETDGSCSLIHMQFTAALDKVKESNLFSCILHGAGGDGFVGGDHLFEHSQDDSQLDYYILKRLNLINFADSETHKASVLNRFKSYYQTLGNCPHVLYIDSRIRSFLLKDIKVSATYGIECRMPFLDNDFQEFLYAVPNELKHNNYLYSKMLLAKFPDFFETIPRQGTGVPISPPGFLRKANKKLEQFAYRIHNKLKRVVRSQGFSFPEWDPSKPKGDFYDYNTWLREEPARSFVEEILLNPEALYPAYISEEKVKQHWQAHLSGEADQFDKLGQILTFEIWLQQVFNGRYRT
ncbi:MAG: asparagine synthase-related protein [Cyanobacteria bacterium J06623_5]